MTRKRTAKAASGGSSETAPAVDIKSVFVTVRAPSGSDQGQVSEGWYSVDADYLQMHGRDGRPITDDRFRVRLNAGQDASQVARELTRQIRREAIGTTAESEAFNRPLGFERSGFA